MELGFAVEFSNSNSDFIGGKLLKKCHLMQPLISVLGKSVYYCLECHSVELVESVEVKNEIETESIAEISKQNEWIEKTTEQNGFGFGDVIAEGFDSFGLKDTGISSDIEILLQNRTVNSKPQKPQKSKRKKLHNILPSKKKEKEIQYNIEYEIEEPMKESFDHEEKLLKEYFAANPQDSQALEKPKKTLQIDEWNEDYEVDVQKYLIKFQKMISFYPEQVVRYQRGGQPLWFHSPQPIPSCPHCNVHRIFEFQIMPYLISIFCKNEPPERVKELIHQLDFITILIFCCPTCDDSIVIVEKEIM
jgi:hypothetical protein